MPRSTTDTDETNHAVTTDDLAEIEVGTEIRWNDRRERSTVVQILGAERSSSTRALVEVETVRGAHYRLTVPEPGSVRDAPEVARRTRRYALPEELDEYAPADDLTSIEIVANGADVEAPVEAGDRWTAPAVLDDGEPTTYSVEEVNREDMTVTVAPSGEGTVDTLDLDYVDVRERLDRHGGLDEPAQVDATVTFDEGDAIPDGGSVVADEEDRAICMVCGETDDEIPGDGEDFARQHTDEACAAGNASVRIESAEPEPDALVARLTDAGPEEARTIIPTAQAEALVYRDLLDTSRKGTAERLDLSPYTVDDRLKRGRDNARATAAVARTLVDLGLLTPYDVVPLEATTLDEFEETDDASPDEPESEDATPGPWGRIMALDAVAQVTPGEEGGVTTVKLVNSSIEEEETVEDALTDLGLNVIARTGGSDVFKIRARRPGDDTEDASGDEPPKREERAILLLDGTPVPEETEGLPEPLLAEIADTVETTLAADLDDVRDGNTLGTLVLDGETWSFNPARPYPTTDEVATHRDDEEDAQDAEDGAQGDDEDEGGEEPSDEEDGDEEAHTCVCGYVAETSQGLGGHTRHCEEAQAARDAVDEDEATEEASDTDETDEEAHTCVCGASFDTPQALGGHANTCDEAQADRDE